MAEYKGKPLVLCVTDADIPSDYSREEQAQGNKLWICECHRFNRQESKQCERCGRER